MTYGFEEPGDVCIGSGTDASRCACCGEQFAVIADAPDLHLVGEPATIRLVPICPNGCF
jgi:hypothetical protein